MADRSKPLTELIAGFSLCMLAAAFGSLLGPEWGRSWMIFGTFGLVSSVGLDVFRRTQERLKEEKRERAMAIVAEQNLSKVITTMRSSTSLRDALRKIQGDAVGGEPRGPTRRDDPRLPLRHPVTITRLRERWKTSDEYLGDSLPGSVRDISSCGIGLAHRRHLERGPVLLVFELNDGERVSFTAEVLWCEPQSDGQYFSGAKLMDVLNPEETQSEMLVAAR
jgi:hypothetical protein